MRLIGQLGAALGLALCFTSCAGGDGDDARQPQGVVTIYSTTDRAVFQPVIADFRSLYPDIRLNYVEVDAAPLFRRFLQEQVAKRRTADVVLSSAVDLQVKLVNDGFAQPHASATAKTLPAAARWRNELFGLTFEPVVFVANSNLLPPDRTPMSRFDLVRALQQQPDFWTGRIGTYDIETSSVGYLLAAQDARQSSEFGTLIGAFGALKARTYSNMSALIADIAAGRTLFGYNVLASYARRSIAQGAPLRIIYPEDYTLAVVRAAFVTRNAPNPAGAHAFLEYLMSARGQRILATRSELSAATLQTLDPAGRAGLDRVMVGPLRPIPIGPGLLTYLDQQKRQRFLANWRAAFGASAPGGAPTPGPGKRQAGDSLGS